MLLCAAAAAAPEDDFRAGEQSYAAGDVVGAMPKLKRAADAGYAPAQSLYGYILDKSESNVEAAEYYRRAAEQGDADGQFGLGTLHASGEGVARDPAAARTWLERAARQGHVQAVMVLSQAFLAEQLGIRRDPSNESFAWVRKAADLGSIAALDYLAKGYRSGAFGELDLARAEGYEARIRELRPERKKGKGKK